MVDGSHAPRMVACSRRVVEFPWFFPEMDRCLAEASRLVTPPSTCELPSLLNKPENSGLHSHIPHYILFFMLDSLSKRFPNHLPCHILAISLTNT